MRLAGNILMTAGLAVMLCGIVGLIRFRSLYGRLLVSSLIDTAGVLLLLMGAAVRQGSLLFCLKIGLLICAVLLTAPLITHKIGRSAYLSGHREGEEDG